MFMSNRLQPFLRLVKLLLVEMMQAHVKVLIGPPTGFWEPGALTRNGALDHIHEVIMSRTVSIHYAFTKEYKQCLYLAQQNTNSLYNL